jgi:Tol biopolymer transport system component
MSSAATLASVIAVVFVVGACAGGGSGSSSVVSTPSRSATATHASAAPTPSGSATAARPICPDLSPSWAAAASHPNDGVPDPAGRIIFGQIHREDEVIGQVIAPLFSIDADGSDLRKVFDCELERPRISPDGNRIAFSIAMDDGTWQIATIAADGSDLRILTSTTGYAETPDWSPDGSWLIYSASPVQCSRTPTCESLNESLWRTNADGSDQRQVGSTPPTAWDWEPRLSTDGREVVYVRNTPADNYRWSIMVTTLSSGEERVAKADSRDLEHPDWSPDGQFIVYNVTPNGPIERVPADNPNSTAEVLAGDASHSVYKPAYSPDGSSIVFGCDGKVCRMKADGSDVMQLVQAEGVEFNHFDWGPPTPGG